MIKAVRTVKRCMQESNSKLNEPLPGTMGKNECDTNADTCCLGTNFTVLKLTPRCADVYPYDKSYNPLYNIPIVTGATAYDDDVSGQTFILVFNESLYYGTKLDHTLINPNQVRHYGIDLWDNPYDRSHELSIDINGGQVIIPLLFQGTKLVFNSRVPTSDELANCQHIEMTDSHQWNPEDIMLGKVKTKKVEAPKFMRHICATYTSPFVASDGTKDLYEYIDPSSDEAILHDINPTLIALKELATYHNTKDQYAGASEYEQLPARRTFTARGRHAKVTSEAIAELWCIGLRRARDTMGATTQYGTRSAVLPLSRRYKADRMYKVKTLDAKFATDTFYADVKSLNQNTCAQIYSNKVGFAVCYPMIDAKGDRIGRSLNDFVNDFGVPRHLTFDGATAQKGKYTLFMKTIRKYQIKDHMSSPRRPNENPAESAIREVKKRWYRIMLKKRVPRRLWDYGIVWVCETSNISVSMSRYAKGRTPLEVITGETPDISEYLDFGFYDWVVYRTNAGLGELSLGRWLGVSHKVGQLMSYWILAISGHVISCTNVQRLTNNERQTDEWKQQMQRYDNVINERLKIQDNNKNQKEYTESNQWNRLALDDDDPEFVAEFNRVIDDESIPDADNNVAGITEDSTPDAFDGYLNMEIGLPRGEDDKLQHAIVKRRKLNVDGDPVGTRHNNPLLDTREYEVEFIDGTTEVMSANIIAENLLSQVDQDGHRQMFLKEIVDHRMLDDAITKDNAYFVTNTGTHRRKQTTRGWELCVQWADGSTDWVKLKDLKHSYPLQLADYATNNNIADEAAFAWWVPYTKKKRKAIISKIKSKYWQRSHKYGIRVPKSVKEALEIDKEEGNNVWRNSIEEEMKKIKNAFKEYNGNVNDLVGYQQITTHMIFDIKLGENFRRKSRLVADGHKTDTPASVTYSSVVSRDSVRICLLLAALNDLDVQSGDIENAYLTAPCREKCWCRGGPEFGSDEGKVFIVTQALYGLKSSGAAFRSFLAETLDSMGFKSSLADPDVWLRAAVKPDGEEYYEYILVYVDDILCMSHKAIEAMQEIQKSFKLKKNKIEPPEIYLGARLEKKKLNGRYVWSMSSTDYVKAAINNLEETLKKKNKKLPNKCETPMTSNYSPELDGTPELDSDGVTRFQELIGILRWAIELGRVDILTEVSMLSTYQASPRQGHMEQLMHIFGYLRKKPKLTLYFDPMLPRIDPSMFNESNKQYFKDQYKDAQEEIPDNMPKPRGRQVHTTAFVDASHAANKVTRRSHTGFIIFVNRAPITWYSKRQNTVESSTFSSEFIALKTCMESVVSLRYKLRMFGIPFEGPTQVMCDNQGVVDNTSKIESKLNKKHNAIAYHAV